MVKRIILDVDTGTDDACAIMLALKSPELQVEALTSVMGNSTIERTTRNTCKILEIVKEAGDIPDVNIPVAQGLHQPLVRLHLSPEERAKRRKKSYHGFDGLGGLIDSGYLDLPKIQPIKQHAVDLIIETVMENPGEITLLPVGPLSNVAMAILKEPRLVENVKEIIHMGGAYFMNPYGHGNVTPMAEFNDWCDPEAAKIVFECGARLTVVGLDVTTFPTARITEDLLKKLRSDDPVEDFIIRMCRARIGAGEGGVGALPNDVIGANIHDALAVAITIDRSLVTTKPYFVQVVTMVPDNDPTRGMTLGDKRPQTILRRKEDPTYNMPNVDVCTEVDGKRWSDFFIKRIMQ